MNFPIIGRLAALVCLLITLLLPSSAFANCGTLQNGTPAWVVCRVEAQGQRIEELETKVAHLRHENSCLKNGSGTLPGRACPNTRVDEVEDDIMYVVSSLYPLFTYFIDGVNDRVDDLTTRMGVAEMGVTRATPSVTLTPRTNLAYYGPGTLGGTAALRLETVVPSTAAYINLELVLHAPELPDGVVIQGWLESGGVSQSISVSNRPTPNFYSYTGGSGYPTFHDIAIVLETSAVIGEVSVGIGPETWITTLSGSPLKIGAPDGARVTFDTAYIP